MIKVTILILHLSTGSLGFPAALIPEQLEGSVIGLINNSNQAAQLAASLASQHSTNFTSSSIHHVNNVASLASAALGGWLDNFNHFLNTFSRFVSGLPFIGAAIGISNSAIKTETGILNEVGQNVIETSNNVTNMNLRALDKLVQADLDTFVDNSNKSTYILSELVRDEADSLNEGAQNTYDAFYYRYNDIYEYEDFY